MNSLRVYKYLCRKKGVSNVQDGLVTHFAPVAVLGAGKPGSQAGAHNEQFQEWLEQWEWEKLPQKKGFWGRAGWEGMGKLWNLCTERLGCSQGWWCPWREFSLDPLESTGFGCGEKRLFHGLEVGAGALGDL